MRAKEKKIRKLTAKLAKKKMEGREVPVGAGPEWVLDVMVPECVGCHAQFTLIKRRHHCRNCGKVFCGKCTSLSCSIEELGYTEPVRVCEPCFAALHTNQPMAAAAGGSGAAAQQQPPPRADTGGGQ
ncbi:FYVE zinc finger domain containing protein [Acanthamoeba castellanii str. Neff]|uniref:FYVE zinc finger domain containing protein n=1 Tax=Acanthamoeba castellanii (strain ATCC 30010 / Neff) TaxID=1257118 RepID=L8H0Y5_ACACF|nr:FYVE zinc finger domain containing protein [Acanthamoeba castellanii str. Neff]ELR18433.1 FYVE zinc finger domain containing protein [Acanthamoeba castellanii str. Neff]